MASVDKYTTWGTMEVEWEKNKYRVVTFVKRTGVSDVFIAVLDERGLNACNKAMDFIESVMVEEG
jgi:hypothetical protein